MYELYNMHLASTSHVSASNTRVAVAPHTVVTAVTTDPRRSGPRNSSRWTRCLRPDTMAAHWSRTGMDGPSVNWPRPHTRPPLPAAAVLLLLVAGCYSAKSVGVDVGLCGSWNHTAKGFWPLRVYTNANISYAELISFGAYVAHDDEGLAVFFTPDIIDALRKVAGRGDDPLRLTIVPMLGMWYSDGEWEPLIASRIDYRHLVGGADNADGAPRRYAVFSFGHGHRPDTPDWRYFIRYAWIREW